MRFSGNRQNSLISPHAKICTQLTESTKHVPKTSCAFLEDPNGMCCILEVFLVILYIFGRTSQDVVQFLKFFIEFLEVPYGIFCIFGSSSCIVRIVRVPHGIVYILEVPHGILCIIRSQSWDFVHFREILVGLCAFLEVPHIILCIFGSSSWDFVHFWNFLMAKHTRVHFILSIFLYKIHVFATCILIDSGYRWLQPVQNVIL